MADSCQSKPDGHIYRGPVPSVEECITFQRVMALQRVHLKNLKYSGHALNIKFTSHLRHLH